jgi:hypothetical protein
MDVVCDAELAEFLQMALTSVLLMPPPVCYVTAHVSSHDITFYLGTLFMAMVLLASKT